MELCVALASSFCLKFLFNYFFDSIIHNFKSLELQDYKLIYYTKENYGYKLIIECINDGNITDLKSFKESFDKKFKCNTYIENINFSNKIEVNLITKSIDINYSYIDLEPHQLLVGYDYKLKPIIIDMRISPHLGVVGISNNGKSKCIELMLKNLRGAEVHLLNTFDTDFRGLGDKRINGDNEIIDYLYYLTHDTTYHVKPLYVVIDEYNVISELKYLDESLSNLLRQARHRNIFVILIAQQLNKENCVFKDLFNSRLAFNLISNIKYYSFLGESVEINQLKQREFIILSNNIYYGKSYKIV